MKIATASLAIVAALLVVAQLPLGIAFSSTSPAFLWSSHLNGKKEMVDYRTLAPRDLAKSAMTEGGWSKYLCWNEEVHRSNNFAFLFIGSEIGLALMFLFGHHVWATGFMFLISWWGYWQELIETLAWAHERTPLANLIRWRDKTVALSIVQSRLVGLAHFSLQSLDVSRPSKTDPSLIDLLKDSFSNSNTSMVFPYVVAGDEKVSIESSLISEFAETCQHNFGVGSIALVGSCSVEGDKFDKVNDVSSVHDYLNSRIEMFSDGNTDLIVLCPGGSQDSDQPDSESKVLSQLLNAVDEMGAKYTFLYISDPFRSVEYLSRRGVERFLAEGTLGNVSTNTTGCDGVCQIKSSLLEGFLVGLVLLIILISGLCCMMGIDTPTRFETPETS